tara:strand:+ start:5481 stop:6008 length:528 start_codon:yes stop_codon:yes gene_type:complete
MEDSLYIAKKLIGAKYKLWLGDFQKTNDTPEPFYINEIPNIEYVRTHGINCAGLINIMRLNTSGSVPGEGNWRGGTLSWYEYLKSKDVLIDFDYRRNYPKGTLLLRNYRNENDQGHLAVICEKDKQGKWLNDDIIHAHNNGSDGLVGICKLGFSHYIIPEGYYEYAILPEDWLYK